MIHPFTLIIGRFCPMILGLFICLGSLQQARAQDKSKQEIDLLLDYMSKELYQFNYFDSLNNEPHFFTFLEDIRKISLMAASLEYDEGYYRSQEVRAKYYSYNDVVYRVYEVYDSAAHRAGKLGDIATQARFTYLKGAEYRRNDSYDIALEYYNQAFSLADSLGLKDLKNRILLSMGSTAASMRQDEKAIEYYRESYDTALELEDTLQQIGAMSSLGIALGRQGHGDSAL